MPATLVGYGEAMDHAAVRAEVEAGREPLILVGRPRHPGRLAPSPTVEDPGCEIIRSRNGAIVRLARADCDRLVRWAISPEVPGTLSCA